MLSILATTATIVIWENKRIIYIVFVLYPLSLLPR